MNITQIRNATIVVEYANKKFLIDPMLAENGTYPAFPETIRQDLFNPLVSLPTSIDNILGGVDVVIITHLYLDHFHDVAKNLLPKNIKMFVKNEADAKEVKASWQSKVSFIRPLIEEADEEFAEKHYAQIDLDSLRNVLETMKKVNASISQSNNRIAICLTIN